MLCMHNVILVHSTSDCSIRVYELIYTIQVSYAPNHKVLPPSITVLTHEAVRS